MSIPEWSRRPREEQTRLVIDLGIMAPLRFAQHQQWHDLFMAGPTPSVVGTFGNDFPGFYYYDPRNQKEYVAIYDGQVDWRSSRLERRIVEHRDGSTHLMVGLFSSHRLDKTVKLRFISQERSLPPGVDEGERDAMPDQWEALKVFIHESFKLAPIDHMPEEADWATIAEECLSTLTKRKQRHKIGDDEVLLFFETFQSESSTYKPKADKEYPAAAELICQAGLAASLLGYAHTAPRNGGSFTELGMELESTLHKFYDPKTGFFQNTFPQRGEEWRRGVIDTWYAFQNLVLVARCASLAADDRLRTLAHSATDRAVAFVQSCDYQIPLFAKLSPLDGQGDDKDGSVVGFAHNPSVLGMYALLLVEAAEFYPGDAVDYRAEARAALAHLHRQPWPHMFHQTVQLSWAAWAAHRLENTRWRDDFTRLLLLGCYRSGPHAGLFQGCAGLSYPAFRETVEAVCPWAYWLTSARYLPLEAIISAVNDKARLFLSAKPHAAIPQEGLATLEQSEAGSIGLAIYATPQIFDLAKLQLQGYSN